jgi:uncharacterized membrane protein
MWYAGFSLEKMLIYSLIIVILIDLFLYYAFVHLKNKALVLKMHIDIEKKHKRAHPIVKEAVARLKEELDKRN